MSAQNVSYADAAGTNHPTARDDLQPLGYAVNQNNSGGVANGQAQRLSVVTIEDPLPGPSRPPMRSSLVSQSRRPSLLSRITSRPPSTSESISRLSSSINIPVLSTFDEENVVAKSGKKKRRPRAKRRKRSTHGDFLVTHNRNIEVEEATPLVTAITDGDLGKVRELLLVYDPSLDHGATLPLQAAAKIGNENAMRALLESRYFDINARDSKERTALYVATAKGYDNISRMLLQHDAIPLTSKESKIAKLELKRWQKYEAQFGIVENHLQSTPTLPGAELMSEPEQHSANISKQNQRLSVSQGGSEDGDHIYILEASSFENSKEMEDSANRLRERLQQRGEWVTGPMETPQLSQEEKDILSQHRHARYPGFEFEAPIVEFDFRGNGKHRIVQPAPTVDELLYGSLGIEEIGKGSVPSGNATVRWYHLPANNLGWTEDLIRKIYEKRNLKEQRKRDVILSREPFASPDRESITSTLLDPRPQSRSLRPQYRSLTLDRDGTKKLSAAISIHMPFAHWETEESRAEMHHVMEVIRSARKDDIDREKGAQKKLPDLKTIQDRADWSKNEKMLCAYLYNSPPMHPRRTIDQFYYHMLEDTEHRDQDQVISRFYHNAWKRDHNLPDDDEESKFAMPSAEKPGFSFSLEPNIYSKFEIPNGIEQSQMSPHGSVPSPQQAMLKSRVNTRVDEIGEPENISHEKRYVLMVDQLWLWILDDNTIITSFPQNYENKQHKNENDSLDVLKSIYQYLSLVNRPPLESVNDIAQLIVYKCLASFCTKGTPYGAMQILDVYEGAIATVTDRETKIFNDFALKSKQKIPHEQLSSESRDRAEELYNIDQEIEQLKEVKDIQDELHILSVLLDQQTTVLQQATQALEKSQKSDKNASDVSLPMAPSRLRSDESIGGQVAPYSSKNNFAKLHSMVVEQEKRRKGLEVQAEQANNALNHLLDLKQKQANVSEARSARWTAESTKQQGNIMVLFTLVTIVFAPLSLMVTIFQLNVVEFPDNLHLDYVVKYMFVVSIAVIVPLLGLVIYTTRVAIWELLRRIKVRIANWRWFHERKWQRRTKELSSEWDQTDEGTESTMGMEIREKTEKRHVRERIWRKGNQEAAFNAENGV